MAHKAQFDYVQKIKSLYPSSFSNSVVYDFGSLDINGSNKEHFENSTYTGIDIGEGKNVDVISKAHEFKPRKKADVVISTEMLEHDMYWEKSLENMLSVLKPNGLLIITCATTGRREHGTARSSNGDSPFTSTSKIEGWSDYYKNLGVQEFVDALDPSVNFKEYEISIEEEHKDIQFYGIKR